MHLLMLSYRFTQKWCMTINRNIVFYFRSQTEKKSTEGHSVWKVEQRHGKFGKTGLKNWCISKSQKVSARVSVPCWHATSVVNAPRKPLVIRWRSGSVLRSWNWYKVLSVGKSLKLVKGQNVILEKKNYVLYEIHPRSMYLTTLIVTFKMIRYADA